MRSTPFDIDAFDDGFVEEPPAPEPPSSLAPVIPEADGPTLLERFVRQVGHRAAIAALLVLLGAAGAILARLGLYWVMLLIAFISADVALLCGVIASWLQRKRMQRDREPMGLIIYSAILLIPILLLVVMAKHERLDGLITSITGK